MANGVNEVTLIGYCGRDPEVRSTQSGDKVAQFSLATTDAWKDKATGERKEVTEWHRIVIWNANLVDVAEKYVTKGSLLHIRGAIKSRKYTDKDGVEKTSTEIVLDRMHARLTLLGSRDDNRDGERERPAQQTQQRPARPAGGPTWDGPKGGGMDDLDSEIPF